MNEYYSIFDTCHAVYYIQTVTKTTIQSENRIFENFFQDKSNNISPLVETKVEASK